MKHPYIPFYIGDWLKDPRLSLCSPATRGVWIDLICAMHEFDRSGELRGTSEELARLARCSTAELVQALTDLQNKRAADVLQRNGSWSVANRRMKREADIRAKRQESGSKGGSKSQASREQKPEYGTEDEGISLVREFARGKGVSLPDADWFFLKCVGNGWTNGGQPIRDWKATLLCWFRAGWLPSQKQRNSFQFQSDRKKPAPTGEAYQLRPVGRDPTDEELAEARRVAKAETEKLRADLGR